MFVDVSAATRRHLLEAGYAWVDVGARGSGSGYIGGLLGRLARASMNAGLLDSSRSRALPGVPRSPCRRRAQPARLPPARVRGLLALRTIGTWFSAGALRGLPRRATCCLRFLGITYRHTSAWLVDQAGLTRKSAATGAVTLIQWFGGNIRFPTGNPRATRNPGATFRKLRTPIVAPGESMHSKPAPARFQG